MNTLTNKILGTSVAVVYQPGMFGSYFAWLLGTIFSDIEIKNPLVSENGTSHTPSLAKNFVQVQGDFSDYKGNVAQIHVKHQDAMNMFSNMDKIEKYFDKILFLYPKKNMYLSTVNNCVYKAKKPEVSIWDSTLSYIDREEIYQNYPVKPNTPIQFIPQSILREHLSYNLFNSWESQVEWYFLEKYKFKKNVMVVFVDEILYNIEKLLDQVEIFLDLPRKKKFGHALQNIHTENLSYQKYLNEDSVVKDLLSAFYSNKFFEYKELTLVTQAFVQNQLEKKGYRLLSDGLDIFPTNTIDLRKKVRKND